MIEKDTQELEHLFNDDLLLDEADQKLAQKKFPKLYHVLNHPELREKFSQHDNVANDLKIKVQKIGVSAVFCATIALFSSILSIFLNLPTGHWAYWLLIPIELIGILGTFTMSGALLMGKHKRKWLIARFLTESLRQWRFEMLITELKEINASLDASDSGAKDKFEEFRANKFDAFVRNLEGNVDSYFESMINDPGFGYNQFLDHAEPNNQIQDTTYEYVFDVYDKLRFKHQKNYSVYKLQSTTNKSLFKPLQWPVSVLQRRIEKFAALLLVGSMLLSFSIIVGYFLGWPITQGSLFPTFIMMFMILNVSLREIQDGLALSADLQRYNDYAGKINHLNGRFDCVKDEQTKLRLMEEMERAAFEELKGFIRAHHRARFII